MILNPEWLKPKEKPYFHQISLDCLEKLVECMKSYNAGVRTQKQEISVSESASKENGGIISLITNTYTLC